MNPGRGIPVNPEQVRNELQMHTAEVTLHEQELAAFQLRAKCERFFWRWLVDNLVPKEAGRNTFEQFIAADKKHEESEVELRKVEIAKLQSKKAISQAILDEVERIQRGEPEAGGSLIVS